MILLILGLALWVLAHWFKRLAPDVRTRLGDRGKGLVAVLIVLSIVLMIIGYRGADFIPVWSPPSWAVHLNNSLMVLALWVYGSSAAKGAKAWPAYKTRHPQLLGFSLWAAAHLLVNGDLAAIILFGGLLIWAASEVVLINRAEPGWTAPPKAGRATTIRLLVITLVLYASITAIHASLGAWPFPS